MGLDKPVFEAQTIKGEHDLRVCSLGRSAGRVEQAHRKVRVHVIVVPELAASKSGCSVPRIEARRGAGHRADNRTECASTSDTTCPQH